MVSAKKRMHDDKSSSYRHLAWSVKAIANSNPSSHCVLECDSQSSCFKRKKFMSFHVIKSGLRFAGKCFLNFYSASILVVSSSHSLI